MDIVLRKLRESLPDPLLVFVLLEKAHPNVALLDALDNDEDLGAAVDVGRDPAHPRDLQVPRRRVLKVVDRVRKDHRAEGSVHAALIDVVGLEAQHHRVHLRPDDLLGLFVGLELEREILGIAEDGIGRVEAMTLVLQKLHLEAVVDGVLDVLLAGVNDAEALPHLFELLPTGQVIKSRL